jgi:hypothetical protein
MRPPGPLDCELGKGLGTFVTMSATSAIALDMRSRK